MESNSRAMYEVILYPDAHKFYIAADKAIANKIAKCLIQLVQDGGNKATIQNQLKAYIISFYNF